MGIVLSTFQWAFDENAEETKYYLDQYRQNMTKVLMGLYATKSAMDNELAMLHCNQKSAFTLGTDRMQDLSESLTWLDIQISLKRRQMIERGIAMWEIDQIADQFEPTVEIDGYQ